MSRKSDIIMSNIIWKFAERVLAQIISLVVSVVLARLLLPVDYGMVSMVLVFIVLADIFVKEGIPSALIQKKDADEKDFSSVFFFNMVLSTAIYLALFIGAPYIADFYHQPELNLLIRVLGICVIIAAFNSIQHSYVSRHMMFKKYFLSTLLGTVVSGMVGIIMAYHGFGVWALVSQYMINTSVDTVVLFFTVKWRPKCVFSIHRLLGLISFGWKMLFEGLTNTVASQLRNLIIGKMYTAADLAYYTKGQQFPALIVSNITVAIGSVLFPVIANEQDDHQKVLHILRLSVRVSSYVVFPLLFGLAVTAPNFVSVILTDKWIEVVPFVQVFCLNYLPQVGMIPRHQALNGIGRSDIYMKEHILARVIGLIILFSVYRISVFAIVVSLIISTVILSFIIAYTSKRFNDYGYRNQINDVMLILVGCSVMCVPVYCINFVININWIALIIQIIVGAMIYLIYSVFFLRDEYEICKGFLLSIFAKAR